jgi:hypothetical protein
MSYTAQVHLVADSLAAGLSEVRRWLDSYGIAPMTFHYRMGLEAARQVESNSL